MSLTEITDADRVYPGDGICPYNEVIPLLYKIGFRGALSLELFNKSYWANSNPKEVLKTGYRKSIDVIDKALEGVKC